MTGPCPRRRASRLALLAAAPMASVLTGCTYDFDAPFGGGEGGAATSSTTGPTTSTASEGGGSGAGAPTTTSSQGGGGPADEDCADGVDDDGDGAIDCADSRCADDGWRCAPPVPAGFEGPVAIVRGDGAVAPTCGGAFPELVLLAGAGDLVAAPAECTPCECAPPSGVACEGTLVTYADDICFTSFGSLPIGESGCQQANASFISSARGSLLAASGGACAPSGGVATVPPAEHEERLAICRADGGGGCDGAACLLPPSDPFAAGLCVFRMGDVGCDAASAYTVELALHGGVDDTRGCGACSCADPVGAGCEGTTEVFGNGNCNGQSRTVAHDDACDGQVLETIRSYESTFDVVGGSCVPSGGAPEGSAFPIEPLTVCCVP